MKSHELDNHDTRDSVVLQTEFRVQMSRFQTLRALAGLMALMTILVLAQGVLAADRPEITNLRTADHDGVIRIVLDVTQPISYRVANGEDAARLEVDLPAVTWLADLRSGPRNLSLLRHFEYVPALDGRGMLRLEFSQAVTLKQSFTIPPPAGGSYRLVFDVGPAPTTIGPPPPKPNPPGSTGAVISMPHLEHPVRDAPRLDGDKVASGPVPAPQLAKPGNAPPPLRPPPETSLPVAAVTPHPREGDGKARRAPHSGKPVVILDPGHGGVDPGAISVSGAYEKNIVLALARDVKAQLDKDGKVICLLTRERDQFVALRERVAIARNAHADLFMSLHADTVADPLIRGLSVYTLSQNASDAEAQALADKENKADIVAGIDLSNESAEVTNILIDLVQRESMNLSAVFAQRLVAEVSRETHVLLQNSHRFAGFAVLKAPDVPSVLVETGYLSNERDEQMLRRPEYRAKLAGALARAIERYFAQTQKARRS